jgi:hypothetical protein
VLDGDGWLTPRLGRIAPGNEPFHNRLGGPQGRPGRVRKILPPQGFDPRIVQSVANRCTVPTELSRPLSPGSPADIPSLAIQGRVMMRKYIKACRITVDVLNEKRPIAVSILCKDKCIMDLTRIGCDGQNVFLPHGPVLSC